MLAAFKAQYTSQEAARETIKTAMSHMQQAQAADAEIEKHSRPALDGMRRAEQELEQSQQMMKAVHSQLARIQQLIDSANRMDARKEGPLS